MGLTKITTATTETDYGAIARQIAHVRMQQTLETSVSSGTWADGYQWDLASDEWAAGASGQTYDVSGIYYHNPLVYLSDVLAGITMSASTAGGSPVSMINDSNTTTYWQPNNLATSNWVKAHLPSAKKIGRYRVFVHDLDTTTVTQIILQGSDTGSFSGEETVIDTWDSPSLTHNGWSERTVTNDTSYGYYRWMITDISGDRRLNWASLEGIEVVTPTDMTLVSPSVPAPAASVISEMTAHFLYKDDEGTSLIGTDLTVELSANGGTNYVQATLTDLGDFDGTFSLVEAKGVPSPSGTVPKIRIKTLNNKSQRVKGPVLLGWTL